MSSSPLNDIFEEAYMKPETLKKMIVDSNPVIGDFILKGQMSFIYGPPNCGKTLLIMTLLKDVTEKIIYLNADDGINGGTDKVKIAQDNNYIMILCGTNNSNEPKSILKAMSKKIEQDNLYYKDKVLIFDTVKKFVNPLDKKGTASFLQLMRRITLAGGTVVLIGHTNKHRDNHEQLVFEGVGDWISDMDCVYSLDFELDEKTNFKTVLFDNQKSRGVIPQSIFYSYYAGKDLPTFELRMNTVEKLDDEKAEIAREKVSVKILEEKYASSVYFIETALKEKILSQSQLRRLARVNDNYTGSDNEIRKCLVAFDGIKWISKNNPLQNNAKEYQIKTDAPLKS